MQMIIGALRISIGQMLRTFVMSEAETSNAHPTLNIADPQSLNADPI
jgi:hypothetical protein